MFIYKQIKIINKQINKYHAKPIATVEITLTYPKTLKFDIVMHEPIATITELIISEIPEAIVDFISCHEISLFT